MWARLEEMLPGDMFFYDLGSERAKLAIILSIQPIKRGLQYNDYRLIIVPGKKIIMSSTLGPTGEHPSITLLNR